MLFRAEIRSLASELHSEMAQVHLMDKLPEHWTYPLIRPKLVEEAARRDLIV